MKHQKLDFFFHQTSIDHHHHHHHHHHYRHHHYLIIIDHRSLSSSVILSVPRFAWRANRRVSFPPAATEYQRKEHLLAGKVRYTTQAHLFLALPLVLCISWSLLVHFSAGLQLTQFCTSYQIYPREPYFLSADNAPPTIKITFPCI